MIQHSNPDTDRVVPTAKIPHTASCSDRVRHGDVVFPALDEILGRFPEAEHAELTSIFGDALVQEVRDLRSEQTMLLDIMRDYQQDIIAVLLLFSPMGTCIILTRQGR